MFRAIVPILAAALAVGCDSKPPAYHVAGKVKFQGKEVPAGVVRLDPDLSAGNDGPQGFAQVRDGAFDTRRRGRPVAGGRYVAHIQGFDGKERPELPLGKPLFPEYTIRLDLPHQDTTKDFEVPAPRK